MPRSVGLREPALEDQGVIEQAGDSGLLPRLERGGVTGGRSGGVRWPKEFYFDFFSILSL